MSTKYSNELRYLKYDNLKQEARIIANYYHDIIRSYGMDCTYYKMSVNIPPSFEKILKSNNALSYAYGLKQAYGYDDNPDFSLSCNMITYTEVDDDIFILDRVGKQNSQRVNFYFDMTDFATKFMTKLGQFKEYPFTSIEVSGDIIDNKITFNNIPISSEILSANVACDIIADTKTDAIGTCTLSNQSSPKFIIPVNEYLARSFNYEAEPGDVATVAYLTYTVKDGKYRGVIKGTVLYYDLHAISQFAQNIHPEVGDVIALDTSFGPQIYEITDSKNQNIGSDGLNPLVYKYIWKCEATRRIASYDDAPMSEGMIAVQDKLLQETLSRNTYSNKLEPYEDNSDYTYGGFKGTLLEDVPDYADKANIDWDVSIEYTDDGIVNLIKFGNGSSLITDGYNLFFKDINSSITKISLFEGEFPEAEKLPINLRYLKADKENIYFQNILGNYIQLVGKTDLSEYRNTISQIEYNDADSTLNIDSMNFYKFNNCKTLLFSTSYNLFAKLENCDNFILLA